MAGSKITKREMQKLVSLSADLEVEREALEEAVRLFEEKKKALQEQLEEALSDFSEEMRRAFAPLETRIESYNEAFYEVRDFVEDKASELEDYAEERSETWHDSDKGSDHEELRERWEECSTLEEFEPEDTPETVTLANLNLEDPDFESRLTDAADVRDKLLDLQSYNI